MSTTLAGRQEGEWKSGQKQSKLKVSKGLLEWFLMHHTHPVKLNHAQHERLIWPHKADRLVEMTIPSLTKQAGPTTLAVPTSLPP